MAKLALLNFYKHQSKKGLAEKYQKEAQLTEPDEYGFGQVEKFDKFTFSFKEPTAEKNLVYIGYPEDFQGSGITEDQIEKIVFNVIFF